MNVLVTGATGYIARHVICQLLEEGYRVRGTMRSLDKAADLRDDLREVTPLADMLECVEADLTADAGWDAACEGCDVVFHLASPFPAHMPKSDDELIRPAVDGTDRVLSAAKGQNVRRVVMLSSFAAIGYGWGDDLPPLLTEEHWSRPENEKDNTAYTRSKTLAEKAAWDFIGDPEQAQMELVSINPGLVLGPLIGKTTSTSHQVIIELLSGRMPAYPDLTFAVVDVRDVARAVLKAAELPVAAGQRFLLAEGMHHISEIADILRNSIPDRAKGMPTRQAPHWLVRLIAFFNPNYRQIVIELGKRRSCSNDKLKSVLGIAPLPLEQTLHETASDLMRHGCV